MFEMLVDSQKFFRRYRRNKMFYSILCEGAALVLFFSDAPLVFSRYSTSWRLMSIRVGVVIYELPSLLDHDHIYSFNEKDPLQCPFGLEVPTFTTSSFNKTTIYALWIP